VLIAQQLQIIVLEEFAQEIEYLLPTVVVLPIQLLIALMLLVKSVKIDVAVVK
jgi:hypothetical protein